MDTTSFGTRLRREREARGVSLESLSAATCIKVRALQALEAQQWDQLPGGAFNRGFLRSIARYLGIDEADLIAAYAAATNDRPQLRILATEAPLSHPRAFWLAAAAAALFVAMVAGGWAACRHYRPESMAPALHHVGATMPLSRTRVAAPR
jgi:cytoskeleton protein RodZ